MSVPEIVEAAPEHDELLYRIYAESRSAAGGIDSV